jgi:hypothetical protein
MVTHRMRRRPSLLPKELRDSGGFAPGPLQHRP